MDRKVVAETRGKREEGAAVCSLVGSVAFKCDELRRESLTLRNKH